MTTSDIYLFIESGLQTEMAQGLILFGGLSTLVMLGHKLVVVGLNILIRQVTTNVYISGTDASYDHFKLWLNQNDRTKRSRNLMLSKIVIRGKNGDPDDTNTMIFSLARGSHWVWLGKVLARITFSIEESKSAKLIEAVDILLFTRSREKVNFIMKQAWEETSKDDCIEVYVYSEWWTCLEGTSKRFSSGFACQGNMLNLILLDCSRFLSRETYYQNRGLPYRRGYLFYGRPGTGKSTLISVLATELKLPLYILPLGSIDTDTKLFDAISTVPRGGILVLEDIDTFRVADDRLSRSSDDNQPGGITLSALLNAIDGITSGNRRIVIMTSNHPEKIDPALLRPGRIDVQFEIPSLRNEAIVPYLKRFYEVEEVNGLNGDIVVTGAELQQLCLSSGLGATIQKLNEDSQNKSLILVDRSA